MLDFKAMFIDYKDDSLENDMELSKRKAAGFVNRLESEYGICSFINEKIKADGGYVTVNFQVEDDKLIKKIFKVAKKYEPYFIGIEWHETG